MRIRVICHPSPSVSWQILADGIEAILARFDRRCLQLLGRARIEQLPVSGRANPGSNRLRPLQLGDGDPIFDYGRVAVFLDPAEMCRGCYSLTFLERVETEEAADLGHRVVVGRYGQ